MPTNVASAQQELVELQSVFSKSDLAEIFAMRLESIGRLAARPSVRRPTERLIDDLWAVVRIAVDADVSDVRRWVLTRQPELNWVSPAQLIRETKTDLVVEFLRDEVMLKSSRGPVEFGPATFGYDERAFDHDHERVDADDPLSAFAAPGSRATTSLDA